MAFSIHAQEIHDYIVGIEATDDWIDRARPHIKRATTGSHNHTAPRPQRDVYSFVLELQAAFGNKFSAASDADWEAIADWLFTAAHL